MTRRGSNDNQMRCIRTPQWNGSGLGPVGGCDADTASNPTGQSFFGTTQRSAEATAGGLYFAFVVFG